MALVCSTCSRVNPDDAQFCYFDGQALRGMPGDSRPIAMEEQPFLAPFVFPTGRSCRNFNELVLACYAEWDEARALLRDGYFGGFLAGVGRADLARIASRGAASVDLDQGLEDFLAELPSTVREPAQLAVEPKEIHLGTLSRSQKQRALIQIRNPGMALLQGKITCQDTPWLALGDGNGAPEKLFHCRDDCQIAVQVLTHRMRASLKPIEGRLVIESNGGTVTLPVRAIVPVKAFPTGVLAGATSPRDIATKAKESPHEAAPLFEQGAVAQWFQDNGWIYPIQGPAATGLGAIQQFFEALGLATAPKAQISTQSVQLQGEEGSTLEHVLIVMTQENRPVYAHAVSAAPWIQIGPIVLDGRRARIPLLIPQVPYRPGEQLQGKVRVTANGNQRFPVNVTLTVTPRQYRAASASKQPQPQVLNMADAIAPAPRPSGAAAGREEQSPPVPPASPITPAPAPAPAPIPAPRSSSSIRKPRATIAPAPDPAEVTVADSQKEGWKRHCIVPGLILLAVLGIVVHDLLLSAGEDPGERVDSRPVIALRKHDGPVGSDQLMRRRSNRFGLIMLGERDPNNPELYKRLTYDEWGRTNNACLKIDDREVLYGSRTGAWLEEESHSPGIALLGSGSAAFMASQWEFRSVWSSGADQIQVTQIAEIVLNEQSRQYDTCLIRYILENKDRQSHQVGIRVMMDTYIGANDGVPFTIPGSEKLCTDQRVFEGKDVPSFIEALENDDLTNPGTVARIQFRLGAKVEAPERAQLGGWPHIALRRYDISKAAAQRTLWEVPEISMTKLQELTKDAPEVADPDSAVVMYWKVKPLQPGERREVGFAYGLGHIASGESKGKLLLTVGGQLRRGGEITVTAIVNEPQQGETVTLALPPGFELMEGGAERKVPPPATGARKKSPVTWKVRAADQDGSHVIRVKSSEGAAQSQTIRIQTRGVFD